MDARNKARRLLKLCIFFLRNLAYYRAWHDAGAPQVQKQFWIVANGNFLDMAVLEWRKIFADRTGKHHFSKVIEDKDAFLIELLKQVNSNEEQFQDYIREIKNYRDKFVAHLDEEKIMNIPNFEIAHKSVEILYFKLIEQEKRYGTFFSTLASARATYEHSLAEGLKAYSFKY